MSVERWRGIGSVEVVIYHVAIMLWQVLSCFNDENSLKLNVSDITTTGHNHVHCAEPHQRKLI